VKSSNHERLRKLFLLVRSLPADERERILDRECAGDAELRRQVEELVENDHPTEERSSSGVLSGTVRRAVRDLAASPAPSRIGPYGVLERLASGGMGEVYLAEQEGPVRRRVAVKLIRPGLDTREVVRRFELERQTLALMQHPNIARVYDAGETDSGQPYFAMEYVDGVSITDYCELRRLGTRARLELLAQVCDGVQHAHQKGVIHRDLKPSNVLVEEHDGRPIPKVIDFGVAKATAGSE
jgi:serine/threonine protein kinase